MKLTSLTFITLFFALTTYGVYFESTTKLIEKVHSESHAEAICFVGVEDGESLFFDIFLQTHPNIPVIIFNIHLVNTTWNDDKGLFGHVLIVVYAVNKDPDKIKVLQQLILQLGVRNFAIIIAEDNETLLQYFLYFWKSKFRRIFGIVNETSFAYFPFTNSTLLINVAQMSPLPNALMNLNGHAIRTSIKLDVPRSFWYADKHGTRKVGGFIARVLTTFLQKYNGTFKIGLVNNNNEKGKEIGAVVNGDLDVTLNPYIPGKGIQLSYPVKLSRWTIMVPLKGYLDPNEYFLRPFSPTVWACIGITCLYIVFMNILMSISMGLPANFWQSFTQIYLTMLNMSLEQTNISAYRFQLIQKIFAFIIVNMYLVFLTSFLTVFIKVKEYDSIQELIDDGFPVMMAEYDWNVTDHKIFPKDFEKILVVVPSDVLIRERYSMKNTSFAYGIGIDAFSFLYSLTLRHSKPKFRLISSSLNQALYGFIWANHAPLHEVLSEYIIRISDYGLIIKWTRDSVVQGSEIVKQYMNLRPEPFNVLFPLTLSQLRFAWNCLWFGLTAAFLVFLGEKFGLFWWKLVQKKQFNKV